MAITIAHRYGNASKPCPVCGTWTKGCSSTADGFHFCRGTEPLPGWEQLGQGADSAGFYHYRRSDDERRHSKSREQWGWLNDESNWNRKRLPAPTPLAEIAAKPVKDWGARAKSLSTGCTTRRREELAAILKLPVDALTAISLLGYVSEGKLIDGVPTETGYWTFPETDATGKIIGIACRWRKGHGPNPTGKSQILTSTRGLTLPPGWKERPGPVIDVEGPTDAAAMHRAGLAVNGRPGASGGGELLAKLYADLDPNRDIIIVGDNDEKANGKWPGKEGAIAIAQKVSEANGRLVKWALPPVGFKDVREYLTADFWGNTPFEVRGERLLAHLDTTAVVVQPSYPRGYDNLTPVEIAEIVAEAKAEPKPTAPPEPCPFAAAADVREQLTPRCCTNPIWFLCERKKTGARGNLPFGCHRPDCAPCLSQKVSDEFARTADWLVRQVRPEQPAEPMVLVGAVVSPDSRAKLIEAVQRRGGLYNWTDTTDPDGCESYLNPAEKPPETGSAVLKASKEEGACTKYRTVFLALLPAEESIPADLSPVTLAGALRAKGNALQSPPPRPDGAKRHRIFGQSYTWGEKPEKKASDIQVKRPSLFGGRVTKEIVAEWGIGTTFYTEDRRIQGNPVGFDAESRVKNLTAELLLSGTGAPCVPDKPRVIELGNHWLPMLPEDIGDGPAVEQVLVAHIWLHGLYPIDAELRAADAKDKANRAEEQAVAEEAMPMLRALKQAYMTDALNDVRDQGKQPTIRRVRRRYRALVKEAAPLVRLLLA